LRVEGLGFKVYALRVEALGTGFRDKGLRFKV